METYFLSNITRASSAQEGARALGDAWPLITHAQFTVESLRSNVAVHQRPQ